MSTLTPHPVTVGEMTSPLGRRIREAVLIEVLAMVNATRCNWLVASEDELDYMKLLVERELDRVDG
jgi:hypothetical protein